MRDSDQGILNDYQIHDPMQDRTLLCFQMIPGNGDHEE